VVELNLRVWKNPQYILNYPLCVFYLNVIYTAVLMAI
jgi:hypothetical protein